MKMITIYTGKPKTGKTYTAITTSKNPLVIDMYRDNSYYSLNCYKVELNPLENFTTLTALDNIVEQLRLMALGLMVTDSIKDQKYETIIFNGFDLLFKSIYNFYNSTTFKISYFGLSENEDNKDNKDNKEFFDFAVNTLFRLKWIKIISALLSYNIDLTFIIGSEDFYTSEYGSCWNSILKYFQIKDITFINKHCTFDEEGNRLINQTTIKQNNDEVKT